MRKALVAAGWAWAGAIVWLSLTPAPPEVGISEGDKIGHFLAYGVLMFWFAQLYSGRRIRIAFALAFIAIGVGLEFIQAQLGYRSYDVFDMGANTVGVLLGWAAALLLPRIRTT
jgi:VanZ family protein